VPPVDGVTLCAIVRVPRDGVAAFQRYESPVPPLLPEHGGLLKQRLRVNDGTTEIHLIWFPDQTAFDAYRADPRRAAVAGLFEVSGATMELLEVGDAHGQPRRVPAVSSARLATP
jgi:hypothetical protein